MLDWAVIGAGPAGIAAVGKILDHGIPSTKVGWVDPHFVVGDLGRKWQQVPSNTRVKLFNAFLHNCNAFKFEDRPKKFHLEDLHPDENCRLEHIVQPLQWVTNHLKEKVQTSQQMAMSLRLSKGRWEITGEAHTIYAKNVILAVGSDPKTLSYSGLETIPLESALNPKKLAQHVTPQDTIGVFGSSHSAILALANVLPLKPKAVMNFYRTPHRYAVHMDDYILYDDTGLKGFAAEWAKENLDGCVPSNLHRISVTDHSFPESQLALCNKAIYAVGFQRRKLPVLEQYAHLHYDDKTGIIAPGLYGVGIAFPQAKLDPLGHLELRVGLWKFMDYLNFILPLWMKYANK
jgi:cation diffusion facilitator CzcD-associated flavoprotein CzcO